MENFEKFHQTAKELLAGHLSQNMQRHCFAVGAIMEGLAKHFNEDKEKWLLTGMLHDVDYEATDKDLNMHSKVAAQWLEEKGFPADITRAVLVHNDAHALPRETLMERCLIFADGVSGLIVTATLVLPSKKLADLKTSSVLKKFKQKDFAAGVSREEILLCEKEGFALEDFVDLAIKSMSEHALGLGL